MRNILAYRQTQRGRTPKIILTRQNVDGLEIEFSDMLIEDQNNAALSYVDCMIISCQVISVDSDYLLRPLSSAQADYHGCESRRVIIGTTH